MNEQELEELLNRYRPVGPPDDFLSSFTKSPGHQLTRSPRAWPWAVAAAALLAITIGLHVVAFVPRREPASAVQADLARQLGGDALADRVAQFIAASQARRAANEEARSWETR